jgi:hypothetical protein
MKKFLFSATFAAFALIAVPHATAIPISPIHGAVTISWTINQQDLNDSPKYPEPGKTNITGSATSKATNILQVLTSSFTTTPFNDASLLALLANSLDTNFPAGTQLVTDGNNVYVADHTGTNAIVDITTILTVTGTNKVTSGLDTQIQTTTKAGRTSTDVGNSSGNQFIIVSYSDAGQPATKDGTTTTFQFVGVSAFSRKGSSSVSTNDVIKVTDSGSFKITGSGYGSIRGTNSVIEGTILGTPKGTETIELQ